MDEIQYLMTGFGRGVFDGLYDTTACGLESYSNRTFPNMRHYNFKNRDIALEAWGKFSVSFKHATANGTLEGGAQRQP